MPKIGRIINSIHARPAKNNLTKQTNNESTVYKDDDDGEEVDDEVSPTTFPEDTPHIPYEFKEISEVGLFQMSILSWNVKHRSFFKSGKILCNEI